MEDELIFAVEAYRRMEARRSDGLNMEKTRIYRKLADLHGCTR